jgi:hypothetical protein
MLKHIGRKLAIAVTLAALVTPVAFAGGSPTGTDPEPGPNSGMVQIVLALLGLA